MINTVIIRGRLGSDADIQETRSGKAYGRLSVAVSDTWKDRDSGERRERTHWVPVVTFQEGLVEKVLREKARKGADVIIEGELSSFDYTDRNNNRRVGIEVAVGLSGNITFLPSGADGKAAGGQESSPGEPPAFDAPEARDGDSGEGAGR